MSHKLKQVTMYVWAISFIIVVSNYYGILVRHLHRLFDLISTISILWMRKPRLLGAVSSKSSRSSSRWPKIWIQIVWRWAWELECWAQHLPRWVLLYFPMKCVHDFIVSMRSGWVGLNPGSPNSKTWQDRDPNQQGFFPKPLISLKEREKKKEK